MTYDLVVIGAGPAGMSAAINAASYGANVAIVDENPAVGGKLLGQLHEEPDSGWWIGQKIAREMNDQVHKLGISVFLEKEVWGVFPEWRVMLNSGEQLKTGYVLVATGAAEKAIPVPGWTKPGVMAIGAAQTLTNFHRVKPGQKVAIIGVDPLSLAVAHELKMAGVKLAGIFLPPSGPFTADKANPAAMIDVLSEVAHLAPSRVLRVSGKMLKNPFIKKTAAKTFPGFGMNVSGVPLYLKRSVQAIEGENQVERIKTAVIDQHGQLKKGRRPKHVEVDCVCISGGLYPLLELVASVGCDITYVEELGGHIPLYSPELETTQNGVFAAGNITGIEGAEVAMAQGELAGTVISDKLGLLNHRNKTVKRAQQEVADARERALIQFQKNIGYGRQKSAAMWQSHMRK